MSPAWIWNRLKSLILARPAAPVVSRGQIAPKTHLEFAESSKSCLAHLTAPYHCLAKISAYIRIPG